MFVPSLFRRLLVVAAGLASAASAAPPSYPNSLQIVGQALPNQTLVIGSIKYLKNDSLHDCGDLLTSFSGCTLIVLALDGDRAMGFGFRHSQDFSWSLPPGKYVIKALNRNNDVQAVSLTFTVPPSAGPVYIGDLYLNIRDGFLSPEVRDNSDAHKGQSSSELTKSLLGNEDNLGHLDGVISFCSGDWGLPCSSGKQGVSPLLPTKSRGPFAEGFAAKDLRPIIQWTTSSRKDVTYDVALYRGVYFHGVPYRGRLVSYQEGLSQSTWRPEQPLEAGRTYFWSVRVRSGQIVSNWSSNTAEYGTGLFSPVWITMGEWFRFDTPSDQSQSENATPRHFGPHR